MPERTVPPDLYGCSQVADLVREWIDGAEVFYFPGIISIRQPSAADVVALAGETIRIAAGRVIRI